MIERFKSMPTNVKLSILFLIGFFSFLCFIFPWGILVISVALSLAYSIVRIINYIVDGE